LGGGGTATVVELSVGEDENEDEHPARACESVRKAIKVVPASRARSAPRPLIAPRPDDTCVPMIIYIQFYHVDLKADRPLKRTNTNAAAN
jgi:hypothetical protein